MIRPTALALLAALLLVPAAHAQERAAGAPALQFPSRDQAYEHSGTIDTLYDEDNDSSTATLTLPLDRSAARDVFGSSSITGATLRTGVAFAGHHPTEAPRLVTMLLTMRMPVIHARWQDRNRDRSMRLRLDGGDELSLIAVLIRRTLDTTDTGSSGPVVEDTYAIVIPIADFLRVVNTPKVDGRFRGEDVHVTPLVRAALRDFASRIAPTPAAPVQAAAPGAAATTPAAPSGAAAPSGVTPAGAP